MKFNKKKEKRCQYFSPDNASTALFSNALNKHIAYLNKKYEDLVLLCIGTDKITGDCLGPLVGSKLMQQNFPHPLYGTLEKPLPYNSASSSISANEPLSISFSKGNF